MMVASSAEIASNAAAMFGRLRALSAVTPVTKPITAAVATPAQPVSRIAATQAGATA